MQEKEYKIEFIKKKVLKKVISTETSDIYRYIADYKCIVHIAANEMAISIMTNANGQKEKSQ